MKPEMLAAASGAALVLAAFLLGGLVSALVVGGLAGLSASGLWALVKYS